MPKNKPAKKASSSKPEIANQLIIAQFFCVLYLAVTFVPLFNAMDYDAPEWLYVSLLNVVSLGFLFKHKDFFESFTLFKKAKTYLLLLVGFFLVGCLSMITAINVSESLVHLARFVNVIVAFYCLFIFIRKDPKLFFNLVCKIAIVLTVYYSWRAIQYFLGNASSARTSEFILAFPHNFSNVNIYTAYIVIQVPLVIYSLLYFKKVWKYVAILAFVMSNLALLFSASRTALLSLVIIYIITIAFLVYGIVKYKTNLKKETIFLAIFPLLAVILVLNVNRVDKNEMNSFSSLLTTKKVDFYSGKKAEENNAEVKKIISEKEKISIPPKNTAGRFSLWNLAFNAFKENPVLGVGYGNYKAVPKKEHYKNYTNSKGSFANPRRAHSDFLEKLAETGIIGFLFYVSLFVLPFLWFLGLLKREKEYAKQFLYITVFSMAVAYTFDALLNFPLERAPIQLYFVIAVVFIVAFARKNTPTKHASTPKKLHLAIFGVLLLSSFASLASNYLVLKSYQLQRNMRTDLMGKTLFSEEPLKNSYGNIKKQWTNYPQLSYVGTVNKVYLANYAIKAKKYDEALQILNEVASYNGDAHLVKAFKSEIYLNVKDNLDSVKHYSESIFSDYPAFKTNYNILKRVYRAKNDTVNLWRVMNRYTRVNYRDVNEWINKANMVYEVAKDSDRMLKVLDTALAYTSHSKKLIDAKKEVLRKLKFKSYLSKDEVKAKHQSAYDFFAKQQYEAAKKVYQEILKTNPTDYLSIQNIGIIDLIKKDYKTAITNLTRVIKANAFADGKAEYSRGYCYEQLGQIEKSKADYRKSRAKKYSQAMTLPESKYK
ncbi:O-antigen ligase family protein [Kordia sp.]|uniref:O-antigen ligase family protein n=1 Tax=Kordia sp. TaxID=1965332 RepID=UPI003B5CDF6A